MPLALLLAMQASGMVIDWLGSKRQIEMGRMGQRIENASIESNIAQTRLESVDQSVQAMKQLRQNMGTQAAIFAVRGTRGNAGSAVSIGNESRANFNADERMRRMNLLGREAALKAGKSISQLHQAGNEQKIWNSFTSRSVQNFSTNTEVWDKIGKSFGMTNTPTIPRPWG